VFDFLISVRLDVSFFFIHSFFNIVIFKLNARVMKL